MNTLNPNCFEYEAEELKIELLGGLRIDTLDRMQVTMKVAVENRKHTAIESQLAGYLYGITSTYTMLLHRWRSLYGEWLNGWR